MTVLIYKIPARKILFMIPQMQLEKKLPDVLFLEECVVNLKQHLAVIPLSSFSGQNLYPFYALFYRDNFILLILP